MSKYLVTILIIAVVVFSIGFGTGYFYLQSQYTPKINSYASQVKSLQAKLTELEGKKIRAAFIYVGPIGDYGWTYAHDVARRIVDKKFSWLETAYTESVKESDVSRVIDRFVQEGYNVIFTTSYGYMDATIQEAKKYPNVIFFHCSGYKRAPNVGTYFAELYQIYYLNGLMAGALTKTGKIGYVAAYPTPEVIRHINAFTIGVREVNPNATVRVIWIFDWYNPPKAREAAETLISEGCDTLAFTEDDPTVIEVGEEYTKNGHQIYTFSHYSPMYKFGPDTVVSGQIVHWEKIYEDILIKIHEGIYNSTNLHNVDYWWMLKEGAVELGCNKNMPINPKFIPELKSKIVVDKLTGKKLSVYDLVFLRLKQMSEETVVFDPFTGPIYDQNNVLRIPPGMRATHDELWTIDWFVKGVIGNPKP